MSQAKPPAQDPARPRKIIAMLTDEQWRALRVAAAEDDTTLQAMTTTIVRQALHLRRRSS